MYKQTLSDNIDFDVKARSLTNIMLQYTYNDMKRRDHFSVLIGSLKS